MKEPGEVAGAATAEPGQVLQGHEDCSGHSAGAAYGDMAYGELDRLWVLRAPEVRDWSAQGWGGPSLKGPIPEPLSASITE